MCLFKIKKIVKVEIVGYTEGISEDNQLTNYAAEHIIGGFDGMVHAYFLNESEGATTTFQITYDNSTYENKTLRNNSSEYQRLIRLVK